MCTTAHPGCWGGRRFELQGHGSARRHRWAEQRFISFPAADWWESPAWAHPVLFGASYLTRNSVYVGVHQGRVMGPFAFAGMWKISLSLFFFQLYKQKYQEALTHTFCFLFTHSHFSLCSLHCSASALGVLPVARAQHRESQDEAL